MADDTLLFKQGAQIQALELVVKSMITLQLASQAKDEAGFAKAADRAEKLSALLQDHVGKMLSHAPKLAVETGIADLMLTEMKKTVARCFDQPAGQLDEIAQALLAVSDPPSQERN